MTTAIFAWIGTFLTSIVFIPQSYKVIKSKKTQAISLYTYIILILSAIAWIIYGILSDQVPIIVTNCLMFCFTSIILVIKVFNVIKNKEKP